MMKTVSDITKPVGVPTVVTLTPIMIDGMGMCGVLPCYGWWKDVVRLC